ncbi:MAG: undecaprenyldiphospho-muramoylpentapeptide beta-N-acetylglucosaminyltransferase [Alphaproteobacteria bacterium]
MIKKQYFVVISAGGTGGHMSPAAALADDLLKRGYRVDLVTDARGKRFDKMFKNITTHVVKSGTSGAGIIGKIKGALNLGLGLIHATILVKKLKPDLVIGFGGYPSFPAVYAAQKSGIPTILHEQNAIIGKANSMLAPRADRIALSLPNSMGLDKEEKLRAVLTGNPVRPDIISLYDKAYTAPKEKGEFRLLVMGGSLGATVFSKIVPATLAKLPIEYRDNLYVIQQCREADIEDVRAVYKDAGINANLSTFIDDVAGELEKSHLVIGRSGASTVAEVSVAGRPAIYVPYPHHKDQQQKKNADSIADQGGAWVMTEDGFTQDALLTRIETFFQNPESLAKAAANAKECGKPEAAKKLGNLVTAIIEDYTR